MHIDSKQLEETRFGCRMNNMPEDNRASGLPMPHSLHLDALEDSKICYSLRLKINSCVWVGAIETGNMQVEESLENLNPGKASVVAMRAKRQQKICVQQKKNREAMHDQSRKMEE